MAKGRGYLRKITPDRAADSWMDMVPDLADSLQEDLEALALRSALAAPRVVAQQAAWVLPDALVNVAAFGTVVFGERSLHSALASPGFEYQEAMKRGATPYQASEAARNKLDRLLRTIASDTARGSMGTSIVIREGMGYVRMLVPPSCSRCVILAGKFYRWNAGFQRHPNCDCLHCPTTARSFDEAMEAGLIDDPYEYFYGLSEKDQNKIFGRWDAQAIRDGADISQVVNARKSRRGQFTLEGSTRRAYAGARLRRGQRRATPELVYRWAGGDRQEAVRLLTEHGYILPRGQVSTGALRGQAVGFGQFGHGGAYRGGKNASIIEALQTGIRDPKNIYTMTAAERRLYEAERDYQLLLQGINPYSEQALVMRGAPRIGATAAPLTPQIAAEIENRYLITRMAKGELTEMKRLYRVGVGSSMTARERAALAAVFEAERIVLAAASKQARGAQAALSEVRSIVDGPRPLAGAAGGGARKPPASSVAAGAADDRGVPEGLPVWRGEIPRAKLSDRTIDVLWYGEGTKGGHGPSATAWGKTRLGSDWTRAEYAEAIVSIARLPEFIRRKGQTGLTLRGTYRGVTFDIDITDNPRRVSRIIHATPVHGVGLHWVDSSGVIHQGSLSGLRWKEGWHHVNHG